MLCANVLDGHFYIGPNTAAYHVGTLKGTMFCRVGSVNAGQYFLI